MTDEANKTENPAIELLVQADEHLGLGWTHYVSGEFPQAVEEFRLTIESGGRVVDAHYGLGISHRQLGETEKALDELGKAQALVDDESILLDPARRAILSQLIVAQTAILRNSAG
jgi:Flp pilus assembly protein TadD